jgi:hypothetical protein
MRIYMLFMVMFCIAIYGADSSRTITDRVFRQYCAARIGSPDTVSLKKLLKDRIVNGASMAAVATVLSALSPVYVDEESSWYVRASFGLCACGFMASSGAAYLAFAEWHDAENLPDSVLSSNGRRIDIFAWAAQNLDRSSWGDYSRAIIAQAPLHVRTEFQVEVRKRQSMFA